MILPPLSIPWSSTLCWIVGDEEKKRFITSTAGHRIRINRGAEFRHLRRTSGRVFGRDRIRTDPDQTGFRAAVQVLRPRGRPLHVEARRQEKRRVKTK